MSFELEYQQNHISALRRFYKAYGNDPVARDAAEFMDISADLEAIVSRGELKSPACVWAVCTAVERLQDLVEWVRAVQEFCVPCNGSGMSFAGGACQSCRPGSCWHCDRNECDGMSCLD